MCGLIGIVRFAPARLNELDRALVAATVKQLHHRGPDDSSLYSTSHLGLGVARLAMSDPQRGRQPRLAPDQSFVLAFNGELYDHLTLRSELHGRYRFETRNDTETLAALILEQGVSGLSGVDGQYAIAVWSEQAQRLTLVRDRFGIHPLYFATTNSGVVFGSSASLVARLSARTTISRRSVYLALTLWGIPEPLTLFRDVHQARAGYAVEISARGVHEHAVDPIAFPAEGDEIPVIDDDELRDAFDEAVRRRLKADARLALLVSGGVDSGAVAEAAVVATGQTLSGFTLGVGNRREDETSDAAATLRACGHDPRIVRITTSQLHQRLPSTALACCAPLCRTGPIGLDLLGEGVAADGIKGLLTGDGADELFVGYDVFKQTKVRRFIGRHPGESARGVRLLSRIATSAPLVSGSIPPPALAPYADMTDPLYSHIPRWRASGGAAARLMDPALRGRFTTDVALEHVRGGLPPDFVKLSPLNRARYLELTTWFIPFLISLQSDRPLLQHGVEGRYPYLSRRVADLALRTSPLVLMPGLKDKLVLRRALVGRATPTELRDKPKRPYTAGWAGFTSGATFDALSDAYLSPAVVGATGIFDAARVEQLVNRARARGHELGETDRMMLLGVLTSQVNALGHH